VRVDKCQRHQRHFRCTPSIEHVFNQSINQPLNQSVNQSIHQSISYPAQGLESMLWIRTGFNVDSDRAFYLNADMDQDPALYLNADPDPDPESKTNADPCRSGSGPWSGFEVTKSGGVPRKNMRRQSE
jgi:hypothetical protein